MSYANGTTHYNLPQTVGTDKRDWADPNQAFADIDAAIYGAVQDTAQAALDIDALEGRMDTAEQNISTNTGNIAGLDTRLTTAEGAITSQGAQITDTRQDLEDMICAYNEASATSTHAYAVGDYFIYNDVLYRATASIGVGDTIVPDTNCTTTNVTTELLASDKLKLIYSVTGNAATTVRALLTDVLEKVSRVTDRPGKYRIEANIGGSLYVLDEVNHITNYASSTIDLMTFSNVSKSPVSDSLGVMTIVRNENIALASISVTWTNIGIDLSASPITASKTDYLDLTDSSAFTLNLYEYK